MKEEFVNKSEVEKIFWAAGHVLYSYQNDEEITKEGVLGVFNACKKAFDELKTVEVGNGD